MVDFGYSNTNPSFSSSLLDAIYRSIDRGEDVAAVYGSGCMRKNDRYGGGLTSEEEIANFRQVCMIEKWMEKKTVIRRKTVADLPVKKLRKNRAMTANSSSSSSDSSSGGFFSSSEAESFAIPRPKPVRIGGGSVKEKIWKNHGDYRRDSCGYGGDAAELKQKQSGFLKTKSRAMKLYTDLKQVKKPISPGGKLAGFLNSLFTAGKMPKAASTADSRSLKSTNASTCSSASSLSRSCLSKTPSSRGGQSKSSNGGKRSVRFSPASVIVDDNILPFDQSRNNSIRNIIEQELMEKNPRVDDVARDLLRKFHMTNLDCTFDHMRNSQIKPPVFDRDSMEEEDDEDDAASYASSDLFELDNLSAIGMEELPVYETTRFDTHTGITNGFMT